MTQTVVAWAPGRVNLIGDHTDHTGGLALPMTIDLGTEVRGWRGGDRVRLRSTDEEGAAVLPLRVADPATVEPRWARYVAGVVAEIAPSVGFTGTVSTTLPLGAGLSSSAALEVAVALALGADASDPVTLARRCQRAEQRATGVPCGILDQLCITASVPAHAVLLDAARSTTEAVPIPDEVDIVVLHSGERRELATSAYATRRAECERAQDALGIALNVATEADVTRLSNPVLRRRARHVVTENARVRSFVTALRDHEWNHAGATMLASHASLRDDFEVSTDALDSLVASLLETPGVYGARLTGAGFGGCVVALTAPGAVPWVTPVRSVGGARVRSAAEAD